MLGAAGEQFLVTNVDQLTREFLMLVPLAGLRDVVLAQPARSQDGVNVGNLCHRFPKRERRESLARIRALTRPLEDQDALEGDA
jgi:hypothetical protein